MSRLYIYIHTRACSQSRFSISSTIRCCFFPSVSLLLSLSLSVFEKRIEKKQKMGSLYKDRKVKGCKEEEVSKRGKPSVKSQEGVSTKRNVGGFSGERTKRKLKMEPDNDGFLLPENWMDTTARGGDREWPPYYWAAFEEKEKRRGWIWYPYTEEELRRKYSEEGEVVWEHSLWNWSDDINGTSIPKQKKKKK